MKDPDVAEALFSFVLVDVSPDLSHARVHVSVLGDEKKRAATLKGLEAAHGFLQARIAGSQHHTLPVLARHGTQRRREEVPQAAAGALVRFQIGQGQAEGEEQHFSLFVLTWWPPDR